MRRRPRRIVRHCIELAALLAGSACVAIPAAHGQTTAFTYQGQLTHTGAPASGSYDLQFALFDAVSAGNQIGATLTRTSVTVTGGVFTVQLDFGANVFPGADRFLQIGVRPTGGASFTTLSPRQQISSSPYAIRTLSAATADALSSACQGCVQSSHINSVAGSQITGTIPAASVPSGSDSYIQNTTSQQAGSNFNISGNGLIAGNVGIGTTNPTLGRLQVEGGNSNGVVGNSSNGIGVHGVSTQFEGVRGEASNVDHGGVVGVHNGGGLGVYGVSQGTGVLGESTSATGFGGYFKSPAGGVPLGVEGYMAFNDVGKGKLSYIQSIDGDLIFIPPSFHLANSSAMVVKDATGNVGIGTSAPAHQLSIAGGPSWTTNGWKGAVSFDNAAAVGWQGDAAGNRFGIGQSNGGLYFFQTASDPGTATSPANYDMLLTDGGNVTQAPNRGGLVKAMLHVTDSGIIDRCYNSQNDVSLTGGTTANGCGLNASNPLLGVYDVAFPFQVDNRFFSATVESSGGDATVSPLNTTQVRVIVSGGSSELPFYLIVY